jgi:hypothetical protein
MAPTNLCQTCGDSLPEEFVTCASERGCKHHFLCAGIRETQWRAGKAKTWKCSDCNTQKKNDAVPADEMRKFMSAVTQKLEELVTVKKTVTALETSVKFMSEKFDETMKKLEESNAKVEMLEKKVDKLTEVNKQSEKVVADLQIRLRDTEQYARNRNVEISGVEQISNENLLDVMDNISEKLGIPFSSEDIDIIHRVPARRGATPKIIAQFSSRTVRNQWLANKKKAIIMSNDVVSRGKLTSRVYLNTHLTSQWHELLWKARQHGRPKGYQHVWFRDNKILAKKNLNDSEVIVIITESDIGKLT